MTAEAGLAALWLAGALAALQLILAAIGISRTAARPEEAEGRTPSLVPSVTDGEPAVTGAEEMTNQILAAVRPVAVVQGLLALLAMALLITVFLQSDMSVLLVAENSHSDKPWLYKFAGAWGNHEGSMLLWVTILGVAGAAVAVLEHRVDKRTLNAPLGAQAKIALGNYAYQL